LLQLRHGWSRALPLPHRL